MGLYLFSRNEVRNYSKWREIFDSDASAHRNSGLYLRHIWRERGNENNVYFVFEVEDLEKAKAFINAPNAQEQAEKSGVVEGEYHFLETEKLY